MEVAKIEPIKVFLADDHKLFRDGLKRLLELESDMLMVGEANDGEEALPLIKETTPDILLFDINMPRMDGIMLVRELNKSPHSIRFVAVSAYDEESSLTALSAAGVLGFVLKASGKRELLAAIRAAASGRPYMDPRVAGKLFTSFSRRKEESDQLYDLTPREKEIFYWIAQGLSNGEVADKMVLSEKTVKNHVSHVLKKLRLRDRTQAAIFAWRIGFAELSVESLSQVMYTRNVVDRE